MLFRSMLSQPSVLPEIGVPGLDEPTQMPKDIDSFEEMHGQPFISNPSDKHRAKYVQFLESAIYRLYFDHEFAHLYRGHYGLLYDVSGQNGLDEKIYAGGEGITAQTRAMLEWDADTWSVCGLISSMRRPPKFNPNGTPQFHEYPWGKIDGSLSSRSEFLKLYAFAIYTAYRPLMKSEDVSNPASLEWHHPPAAIRAWSAIVTALQFLTTQGVDVGQCIPPMVAGVREAELAYTMATGATYEDVFTDELRRSGWERVKAFKDEWRRVLPRLIDKKRGGRLGVDG